MQKFIKSIKKMKNIFSLLILIIILWGCNSGITEETQKQITNEIKSWNTSKEILKKLENDINSSEDFFRSLLADSLGEQGLKFLEKDSLSNERVKSLKNDYENLKTDYTNLMANYTTLLKETEDWSKKLNQNKQSTDEINEEWESKQRQIQEILSQKEAYEQAFSALKMNYIEAVSEIKKKMNKK